MGGRRYIYPASYLAILLEYVEYRNSRYGGRSSCFSYDGVMEYSWRFYRMRKTTVERAVRRLVEDGYIRRVSERPHAIFCMDYMDAARLVSKMLGTDPQSYIAMVRRKVQTAVEGRRRYTER